MLKYYASRKGLISCWLSRLGHKPLSKEGKIPALDFSKAVVVTERDIGKDAVIDHAEFIEMHDNMKTIEARFRAFLKYYLDCIKTGENLDKPVIRYSALQYFKDEIMSLNFENDT